MASTLRGRREGSRQPPNTKNTQTNRRGSGTAKNSPPPPPTHPPLPGTSTPDSPLTPVPDTPHPSKGRVEVSSLPPKLPALETGSAPPSESSITLPSQAPSSITGLTASKDSSPVGEAPLSIVPQVEQSAPPPHPAGGETSLLPPPREDNLVNLNESDPGHPQAEGTATESALQAIRELDASFYQKIPDALWSWDTLEKRVKGYANYKDLRPEDVLDYGVSPDRSRKRFRVHPALLEDLEDVAEEFENLLLGLRSLDPARQAKPSWRVDPSRAFFEALSGARTLPSLCVAWKGLIARFNAGFHVYAKYLGRAYEAYGACEGAPPASPASTTGSFIQEAERYPLSEEKVRFVLGSIPRKYWPGGLRTGKNKSGGRSWLVGVEDNRIAPLPPRLAAAFPEREPEENPPVIQHEGYRHYLHPTGPEGREETKTGDLNQGDEHGARREEGANNEAPASKAEGRAETTGKTRMVGERPEEGPGKSTKTQSSDSQEVHSTEARYSRPETEARADASATEKFKWLHESRRRESSEQAKREQEKRRYDLLRKEAARRNEERREEERRREENRRREAERERQRRIEEEEKEERERLERRRTERLRAESRMAAHRSQLMLDKNRRQMEDDDIEDLLEDQHALVHDRHDELLEILQRRKQEEETIRQEALAEIDDAQACYDEDVAEVEREREALASQRIKELEEAAEAVKRDRERRREKAEREQRDKEKRRKNSPGTKNKKERVNFVDQSHREEEEWDGDDEDWEDEEEEGGFPETPAPKGRGERRGRRSSIYSFFGQTTPRRTPFGDAVVPPPLDRAREERPQPPRERRRSGVINITRAFGDDPDPDGGDSGPDDNDDRRRQSPSRRKEGPDRPAERQPRTPRKGEGPKRGGDGAPPGDPDGGRPGEAPVTPARPPFGTPTIAPTLKSSNVPAWDGNRATAIAYFWKVNQLARGGRHLAEALGFWLWQRLVEDSSVELWYMTVSEPVRDWMQASAYNWIQGLVEGFLGRRWVNQIASEFKQQAFREGHKHRYESPLEYVSRRLMYARFLGYSQKGSLEELQLIIERVPPHWHHMLSTSTLRDADELKERVIEFESELLASSKQDHADLETSVASILKRHGVLPHLKASTPKSSLRRVAFATEPVGTSHTDPSDEDDLPGLQSAEEESDAGEEDPWEEMVASAYSIVQKRAPTVPKKYLFKRRDDVKTKEKRQPPAPCFSCGSPFHWNKECPHREEYNRRRAREGYVAEPGEASREKAYDAAYAMISTSGFEAAAPETAQSAPEERKSELSSESEEDEAEAGDEKGGSEEREDRQDPEPERREEVLYVNMPSVASNIEVIEESYWHEGGALPSDHPHIMEYVGNDAACCVQPEVDLSRPPVEEKEVMAIPDALPYEDKPIKLKSRIKNPPGQASRGTSVLSVKGRLGSLAAEEIDLRLDSCASLSLISAQLYDSLKNPPPIRKGAKMKLWQLTSASDPIRGYVRLPVFITADDGSILEAEIEAYVVENMTVPILLGEDFQQAYEVAVERKVDEGTRVQFGDVQSPVSAVNVNRTTDFNKVAKSYRGEVPEKAFAKRAHRNKLKREKKRRDRIAKEEEYTVQAAAKTRIPAQTTVRVPLRGPFEKGGEWVIEKTLLSTSDAIHLAVPNTLIDAEFPFVPVANLSTTPRIIQEGEALGKIAIPGDYFDTPKDEKERERFDQHAQFARRVSELNLNPPNQESTKTHECETSHRKRASRPLRMPDAHTYEAWRAGQQPAKRQFHMPSRETYQAWADGEDSEQDEYGPKTAALPEVEEVSSKEFLDSLDIGALPNDLKDRALKMLDRHRKAFALDGRLGDYEAAARIRVKEGTNPIAVPMFGASPAKKAVIDEQIDKWFQQGVIEESRSPWSAPVVIAYRNGKPRFCVDYRRLNAATIPDEFPIPRQQEILASLSGAQVLSSLDALSGFTQLSVHPDDVEKTAFRTHRGLFQFKRLPFGLRNGPSIFQRVMNSVLAPYLWLFALVYIDDIVVYSRSFEDHIDHLDKVLQAIEDAKITLSPSKCHLFYDSIILLGHKVSRLGLSTHYEKVRAVLEMKRPSNRSELATFLGMTVYFNAFIPYYSDICSPLHALLKKGARWHWGAEEEFAFLQAKKALQNAPVLGHPIEGLPYRLYTDASDYALGCALQQVQPIKVADLRGTKTYDRLRALYDGGQPPPRLVTRISSKIDDVPENGDWAASFDDSTVHVERVIGYWSRSFKGAESRYSTTEREALAAKEGLVKFQPYLEGSQILLVTDHSALQWARTYENSNRRLASWGAIYSAYKPGLEIVHRAGRVHSNVDPLSRIPREPPAQVSPPELRGASLKTDEATASLREEAERRKSARKAFEEDAGAETLFVDGWADCVEHAPEAYAARRSPRLARRGAARDGDTGSPEKDEPNEAEPRTRKQKTRRARHEQAVEENQQAPRKQDEVDHTGEPLDELTNRRAYQKIFERPPSVLIHLNPQRAEEFRAGYSEDPFFRTRYKEAQETTGDWTPGRRFFKDEIGLLYFLDADYVPRLCVPKSLRRKVLEEAHENPIETAHGGHFKLWSKLRSKFYWHRMKVDIEKFCKSCDICQKSKLANFKRFGTLIPNPIPHLPYESVSMDFITELPPSCGFDAILVLVDRFSKHAQFVPTTTNLNKRGFANLFVKHLVCKFGVPDSLVMDRDSRWAFEFWKEVASELKTDLLMSSAHHPQHDGQTEVLNRHLETMLRSYVSQDPEEWANFIHFLEFAYNSTIHKSTQEEPFELLLGFKPRSPIDFLNRLGPEQGKSRSSEAGQFLEMLKSKRDAARDAIAKAQEEQAKEYNKGRRPVPEFRTGDRVLVNPHTLKWIESKGPGRKLHQRWIGPFEVVQRINPNTYRLRMDDRFTSFPVFNIDHLKRYHEPPPDLGRDRTQLGDTRDGKMAHGEYEIDRILEHKWDGRKKKRVYKVRWVGFGPHYDSWRTELDLKNSADTLKEYKEEHNL